jgi:hypothetical protein
MVNVFGEFPPASLNALIGIEEVEAATKRMWREHEIKGSPRILGIDIARYGDDASVICRRQGLQVWPMMKYRGIDGLQGAGIVARTEQDWESDATFLDASNAGASWEDQLRQLGRQPVPVYFSNKAHDPQKFFNKRAEMYWDAVQWIKKGGALPQHCPELIAALTQTTYSFKGDRILLEDKEQIKERIGFSPDDADAFVLTFAEPVSKKAHPMLARRAQRNDGDYNPFREASDAGYGQGPYD